jgi:AraC-like DNA-binding protein
MQLLLNTDLKIKEVADRLHFSDEYHFSRFQQLEWYGSFAISKSNSQNSFLSPR